MRGTVLEVIVILERSTTHVTLHVPAGAGHLIAAVIFDELDTAISESFAARVGGCRGIEMLLLIHA